MTADDETIQPQTTNLQPPVPQFTDRVPDPEPEVETVQSEGVAGGHVADDGIEDIAPNPPKVGQWVDLEDGRHAAYLEDAQESPHTILVRTRDADNVVIEVPYDSVRLSTYSGGR